MTTGPLLLPDEAHHRVLVDNAHPLSWTNAAPAGRHNLVVVGAATAGLVSAAGAAGLGARVALVERHLIGGDCLNFGCEILLAVSRAPDTEGLELGAAAVEVDRA